MLVASSLELRPRRSLANLGTAKGREVVDFSDGDHHVAARVGVEIRRLHGDNFENSFLPLPCIDLLSIESYLSHVRCVVVDEIGATRIQGVPTVDWAVILANVVRAVVDDVQAAVRLKVIDGDSVHRILKGKAGWWWYFCPFWLWY